MPLVSRTRAILRSAEFGFFGVIVRTCVQTPRFCGDASPIDWRWVSELNFHRSAGAFVFFLVGARPLRISWLIVGKAHNSLRHTKSREASPHCLRPTERRSAGRAAPRLCDRRISGQTESQVYARPSGVSKAGNPEHVRLAALRARRFGH